MKTATIKAINLIVAIGLISSYGMAQKRDISVPQAVVSAYTTQYPTAKLKKWETKNDSCVAMFTMNKRQYKATYAMNGSWCSTERNMKHITSMPVGVRTFLKNNQYLSWNVDKMAQLNTPMHTTYLLKMDNHGGNMNQYEGGGSAMDRMLYFNQNGQLIKEAQQ